MLLYVLYYIDKWYNLTRHMTIHDFTVAFRGMRRYPLACVIAIASLAAGIGATTAMLTIRNAVFRNPPPLSPHPEELFEAFMPTPERSYRAAVPADVFNLWAQETHILDGIAAAKPLITKEVRTPGGVEMLGVREVTPRLFSLLGVTPIIGQGLRDASGSVISYRFWQRFFGGNPDVLGSVLWIDGRAVTVAGVMPEPFWVFDMQTDVWTSLDVQTLASNALLEVILRRQSAEANQAIAIAFQNDIAKYLDTLPNNERRGRVQIVQMRGTPLGHAIAPAVVWLMAACVILTLFIACTNVAVLVIAQWTGRGREFAIRAALGAGRWRIIRALLAESLVLAVFGGAIGVCATFIFLSVALRQASGDINFFHFSIDARVLVQIAVITVAAGFLTGLAPALYETRQFQANPLRGVPSDRVRQRWRNALVIAEITVTIALLVVTGTMVDGYRRAVSEDLGFNVRPLLAAAVGAPHGVRIAEIQESLRGLPGVSDVAATTTAAMSRPALRLPVGPDSGGAHSMLAERTIVSSGFWTVLGIPLRWGRDFSPRESGLSGAPVAIVNEALAQRMWPGRNPIGMRLWTEGRSYEVVGVAADYKNMPLSLAEPAFYLPLSGARSPLTSMTFYVRAAGNPADLLQAVRSEIRRAGVDHVVSNAFTLQSIVDIIGREILTAVYPMAPLIATGLLLSAAGIYGVLAFAVSRRARELAIRVAVGATQKQIVASIAALGIRLVGLGMLLGIGTTFALSRFAQGQGGVFDSPGLAAFIVPIIIVLAVGSLATWLPSRRALSVNPAGLLRGE
jgi:putative ABC transport system permease protein